jgi:hypothetical protein
MEHIFHDTAREYKTGEVAPVSGVYRYMGHVGKDCGKITSGEWEIPLSKGERFPPDRHCKAAVTWELIREV